MTLGSTVTSLSNDSFNLSNSFLNDPISKLNQYSSFANNVTNLTHETPKRTRFSFKPEHLAVIFKSIIWKLTHSFKYNLENRS